MGRRVIFLGIDAAKVNYVSDFIKKGSMPNLAKMLKKGIYRELIPTTPAITPSSWQSMVTGAWPDTHGLPGFELNLPGTPIDETVQAWQPKYYQAETIFEAASRQRRTPITVNWYGSRGEKPLVRKGVQVAGLAAGGYTVGEIAKYAVSNPMIVHTDNLKPLPYFNIGGEEYVRGRMHSVKLTGASECGRLPVSNKVKYETTVAIVGKCFNILVIKESGKDKVSLVNDKKTQMLSEPIGLGQWSPWISQTFITQGSKVKGFFRYKVLEISSKTKRMRVYFTGVNATKNLFYPVKAGKELLEKFGPFLEQYDDGISLQAGAIDSNTYLDMVRMQKDWLSSMGKYLLANNSWDLYMSIFHSVDHIHHTYLGLQKLADNAYASLNPNYNRSKSAKTMRVIEDVYRISDQWIGEFMKILDDDTVLIVASDHGGVPSYYSVYINTVLEQAGLLKYRGKSGNINHTRTKAYFWNTNYINVNLKSRYPKGSVNKSQYEEVRQQVIDALEKVVDPLSKQRCIRAFRKEELAHLGCCGDRIGDVVFFLKPGIHTYAGFGRNKEVFERRIEGAHAPIWPTHRDMRGVFFAYGKGIKDTDARHEGFIQPVDVAATLSNLLGIAEPAQCIGKSIL